MTTKPKRVELTEAEIELARAVHALTFPTHADCEPRTTDLTDARLHLEALTAAGWVSPEEATAREAAARRDAWDEGVRAAHRSRLTLFAIRRVNPYALAEPERDEEGGR